MKADATVKGHLEMLILAVLADAPVHGYALIEELRRRSDDLFDLPEGTVYPALYRLERSGLLTSAAHLVGGRRRRVYQLTAHGRQVLAQRQRDWRRFSQAVYAVLRGTTCPNPT